MSQSYCEISIGAEQIQQVLNDTRGFDIILMEQFTFDCQLAIGWKLKAPIIAFSSCPLLPYHYDRFANPLIPSYISINAVGGSDELSFSERLENWILSHASRLVYTFVAVIICKSIRSLTYWFHSGTKFKRNRMRLLGSTSERKCRIWET